MVKHKRDNFKREIRTGLYGQMAEGALNNVIEYCRKYGSALDSGSFKLVEVERNVDNEIMLSVFDDTYVGRFNRLIDKTVFKNGRKNDAQIRLWLAGCVKGTAKMAILNRCNDNLHKTAIAKVDGWTRTNMTNLYMDSFQDRNIPAAAYYAVYEILKGRKVDKAKFPAEVFASTVGEPFDPVRVELETYRIEAIEKIQAELAAEIKRLDKEFNTEYEKLRAKFNEFKNAAKTKAADDERNLNNEIFAALNTAA